MLVFRSTFLISALVVISGCGAESARTPDRGDASALPKLDFTRYDAAVSAFLVDHGITGASGVVVHKDRGIVHLQGYGQYPPDRTYLVASSSKILSVGILMRLADQGLLDIDAPIGKYLSAWAPNGKPELEVSELVSNSSGLVGLVDNPTYAPYICQYVDTGTLSDCAKAIYTANDAADRKPPDTSFHYGGGQWQLAGGIAEVVAGKKWAELVKETYNDPCDAPSIGYANQYTKALQSGGMGVASALAYPSFFQGDVANLSSTDNPSIEGGLYTTAEDYGKILLMHLRGGQCSKGRVLSESATARMRVDRILEKYNGSTSGAAGAAIPGDAGSATALDGYGLGWWIDRNHEGVFADPGAYGAFPWLDLSRDYAAFLVIESDTGTGTQLWAKVKPLLDDVFDSAKQQ
jgi:CubicO group peptidase (beta-lactamase class C family)